MKTLFVASLATLLLAGSALAQSAPPPSAPAASQAAAPDAPPPPPPGGPDMRGPGPGAPQPPEGPRGHRPPPPPDRAAHIHLENGPLTVDLKCAEDDSTKSCADIALQMLDRLEAAPRN